MEMGGGGRFVVWVVEDNVDKEEGKIGDGEEAAWEDNAPNEHDVGSVLWAGNRNELGGWCIICPVVVVVGWWWCEWME